MYNCTQPSIKEFSFQGTKGNPALLPPQPSNRSCDGEELPQQPQRSFSSLDINKGISRHLNSEQKKNYNPWSKKQRRFYHRAMSGMASNEQLRFLTLTSSPQSDGTLLTKHASVLKQRIKRRAWEQRKRGERKHARFEYLGAQEETRGGLRHVHYLYKGCYIPQRWLSAAWAELHAAPIVHVCSVRQKRRAQQKVANYVSKYLSKDMDARFLCSWQWCFRGFGGRWEMFKKEFRGGALKRWHRLLAGEKIYVGGNYAVLPPPSGKVVVMKQSNLNGVAHEIY